MSLLLANNGLSGHVAGTSALPPTAEVRAPMSAFPPIWSASPPTTDVPGKTAECLGLTQSSHHGSYDLVRSNPAAPGVEQCRVSHGLLFGPVIRIIGRRRSGKRTL